MEYKQEDIEELIAGVKEYLICGLGGVPSAEARILTVLKKMGHETAPYRLDRP